MAEYMGDCPLCGSLIGPYTEQPASKTVAVPQPDTQLVKTVKIVQRYLQEAETREVGTAHSDGKHTEQFLQYQLRRLIRELVEPE